MSTVEHRTGDLFDQPDLDALAHGANCLGTMGAGIAVRFKIDYPAMFTEYRALCQRGHFEPGDVFAWQARDRWIYNLATQYRPGRDARLESIEKALTDAVAHAEEHFVTSIGMPRIGAGLGGLFWDDVSDVLDRVAAGTDVRLVVVSLPGA